MYLPRTDGGCGREVAQHRPPFPPPARGIMAVRTPQGGLRSNGRVRCPEGPPDAWMRHHTVESTKEPVGSFQPYLPRLSERTEATIGTSALSSLPLGKRSETAWSRLPRSSNSDGAGSTAAKMAAKLEDPESVDRGLTPILLG